MPAAGADRVAAVAGVPADDVVARTQIDRVRAAAPLREVAASAADEPVGAGAAQERVVARAAAQRGRDLGVGEARVQLVVARPAVERQPVVGAGAEELHEGRPGDQDAGGPEGIELVGAVGPVDGDLVRAVVGAEVEVELEQELADLADVHGVVAGAGRGGQLLGRAEADARVVPVAVEHGIAAVGVDVDVLPARRAARLGHVVAVAAVDRHGREAEQRERAVVERHAVVARAGLDADPPYRPEREPPRGGVVAGRHVDREPAGADADEVDVVAAAHGERAAVELRGDVAGRCGRGALRGEEAAGGERAGGQGLASEHGSPRSASVARRCHRDGDSHPPASIPAARAACSHGDFRTGLTIAGARPTLPRGKRFPR